MDWEILAYIFAPLMVVLAFLAYRYWNATASYALRMRESNARPLKPPADAPDEEMGPSAGSTGDAPDPGKATEPSAAGEAEPPDAKTTNGTPATASEDSTEKPEEESGDPKEEGDPLVDQPGTNDSGQIGRTTDPTVALIKELDEQLAALPSGIELIDLPILEKRRIADRRNELLSDRERLLKKKRGAHRHRRRTRVKNR